MNGIHDMGGMHGFGPVEPEADEPLFHAPWESRVLAMTLAMAGWGRWNIDASRFARESAPPELYLRSSYYERWLEGLCKLMVERGLLTEEELAKGHPAPGTEKATPPVAAERVPTILRSGGPTERSLEAQPRYRIGERVRTRNIHPEGHTRLPRYARGKTGEIAMLHGGHVFPDSNARFAGEAPQPLYSVSFDAKELWGPEAAFDGAVHIDLWESYLEPA